MRNELDEYKCMDCEGAFYMEVGMDITHVAYCPYCGIRYATRTGEVVDRR